tara:strand:- start:2488 stop:3954 length:1467 start_codon:yes stop_codon:yes gene_type:complete
MPYIGSSPNFGAVESQTITTANGSTAAFTLNQFVPDSDSIIVTVGNVVQEPTTAYSAVGTTITFTENVPNGDTIVIRYLGRSVDVPTTYKNINRFKFVATGGQDTFQNNDANGLELSYTAGNIDVFMNGVRLDESDFTASNGTSVVLGTNASASDEIVIIAYKSVQIANALDKSSGGTVSGGTTFSGQVNFSGGIFGDVSFDSGVLKIDAGNNRVGVNTNSPSTTLDVNGETKVSGNIKILSDASDFTFTTNSIHLGAGADIKIGHTNNNNGILSDNGMPFTIFTDVFRCNTADNSENLFGADKDGAFFAKHDNTTMFQTNANGILMSANKGIDFANASAGTGGSGGAETSTATVLNDYEEGTFDVSSNSVFGGSITKKGMYVKVGNMVTISVRFTPSGSSTNGHQFGIFLPFKASTTESSGSFNTWFGNGSFPSAPSNGQHRVWSIGGDNNYVDIKQQGASSTSQITGSAMGGSFNMSFSATYQTID